MKNKKLIYLTDSIILLFGAFIAYKSGRFELISWSFPLLIVTHILFDIDTFIGSKIFQSEYHGKIYPYHSFYFGITEKLGVWWFIFLILKSHQDVYLRYTLIFTFFLGLIYLLLKNKKQFFNAEITVDHLIFRDSLSSTIIINKRDIKSITLVNEDKFEIIEEDKRKKHYIYLKRVHKNYRDDFTAEINQLKDNIKTPQN
ncbi:hypothetical protein [Flammeovirga sp. SJP92]|uniref:hypothetical protein n=1 Tax=Flammeovirga sp. SJP92 TaxID=1775430 RepID=UPI000788A532|nr:hypothetical protein [Flammeovirga sp. SJP92]KXX69941.1 hypothetical protein AVL50_13775 [Flammeovirga sp. SJP92]